MTSLRYSVDGERRLVVISGEYANAAEWLLLAGRLLKDPAVGPGFAFLRDLRGASDTHSAATVLAIFGVVQRFWPSFKPAKGAIVTDTDHTSAAQVAQALANSNDLPIQIFTSYDAAVDWLLE